MDSAPVLSHTSFCHPQHHSSSSTAGLAIDRLKATEDDGGRIGRRTALEVVVTKKLLIHSLLIGAFGVAALASVSAYPLLHLPSTYPLLRRGIRSCLEVGNLLFILLLLLEQALLSLLGLIRLLRVDNNIQIPHAIAAAVCLVDDGTC
jgi:hypothetical protein